MAQRYTYNQVRAMLGLSGLGDAASEDCDASGNAWIPSLQACVDLSEVSNDDLDSECYAAGFDGYDATQGDCSEVQSSGGSSSGGAPGGSGSDNTPSSDDMTPDAGDYSLVDDASQCGNGFVFDDTANGVKVCVVDDAGGQAYCDGYDQNYQNGQCVDKTVLQQANEAVVGKQAANAIQKAGVDTSKPGWEDNPFVKQAAQAAMAATGLAEKALINKFADWMGVPRPYPTGYHKLPTRLPGKNSLGNILGAVFGSPITLVVFALLIVWALSSKGGGTTIVTAAREREAA